MTFMKSSEMTGAGQPDLLPARMVNEFAYCPRLAYMEWVQGNSPIAPIRWTAGSSIAGLIARPAAW